MHHHLATLPEFLAWFGTAAAMLATFLVLYGLLTPWNDLRLIRAGNLAVTYGVSGAMLGYAVVLAAIISGAVSRLDLALWAGVGLAVQLLALGVGRLLLGPGLRADMEAGRLSSGVLLGALALAAGIVNAATMLTE